MKYSNYVGLCGTALLILACFLPWAYYPDIDKTFTGFYSQDNHYGRPGKLLVCFAILAAGLFLTPKIWAKRLNLFVAAILVAYGLKTYLLFTSCYKGFCPEKQTGIYLVMLSILVTALAAVLPDLKLKSGETIANL